MKRVLFDIAALIARVITGVIFVAHGWQKWQGGHSAIASGFGEMGIPMPELAAGYAMVVELIGGVLLIIGLAVRPVALLLLLNMLGAIIFAHWDKGIMVQEGGWELAAALGALCLLFLALGGGRIGIDGILSSMFRRRHDRRAAEEDLVSYRPNRTDTTTGSYGTTDTGSYGGPTTPARSTTEEPPDVPRQPGAPQQEPRQSRLNDEDMREIDSLVADEPPQHRKPPNR
ncbi:MULTISPECIES: DoxX family protein [Nonomuraea]|jgi:putative oxidoreductase|uniref:DoxX family protein n=1 Tax=Nonomuraea salmonea TaxID=46181 RepID=A0ABV5NVX9_9ACTN